MDVDHGLDDAGVDNRVDDDMVIDSAADGGHVIKAKKMCTLDRLVTWWTGTHNLLAKKTDIDDASMKKAIVRPYAPANFEVESDAEVAPTREFVSFTWRVGERKALTDIFSNS